MGSGHVPRPGGGVAAAGASGRGVGRVLGREGPGHQCSAVAPAASTRPPNPGPLTNRPASVTDRPRRTRTRPAPLRAQCRSPKRRACWRRSRRAGRVGLGLMRGWRGWGARPWLATSATLPPCKPLPRPSGAAAPARPPIPRPSQCPGRGGQKGLCWRPQNAEPAQGPAGRAAECAGPRASPPAPPARAACADPRLPCSRPRSSN